MAAGKPPKVNEQGRRIGESHPRATLTDHEVELLQTLLDERTDLIERLAAEGQGWVTIRAVLAATGLSYRALAVKFEVSHSLVILIDQGKRRCQTPV